MSEVETGVPLPDGYEPKAGDRLRLKYWDAERWFDVNGRVDGCFWFGSDADGTPNRWHNEDPLWLLVSGPSFDALTAASVPEGCTMRPVPDEIHGAFMAGGWMYLVKGDEAQFIGESYRKANAPDPEPEPVVAYVPQPGHRVRSEGWLDDQWFEVWQIITHSGRPGMRDLSGVDQDGHLYVECAESNDWRYMGPAESRPPWWGEPGLIWQPETQATR